MADGVVARILGHVEAAAVPRLDLVQCRQDALAGQVVAHRLHGGGEKEAGRPRLHPQRRGLHAGSELGVGRQVGLERGALAALLERHHVERYEGALGGRAGGQETGVVVLGSEIHHLRGESLRLHVAEELHGLLGGVDEGDVLDARILHGLRFGAVVLLDDLGVLVVDELEPDRLVGLLDAGGLDRGGVDVARQDRGVLDGVGVLLLDPQRRGDVEEVRRVGQWLHQPVAQGLGRGRGVGRNLDQVAVDHGLGALVVGDRS